METALYNRNDNAYFMFNAGDRQKIDEMKEKGFIESSRLVAMYHETYKKHLNVLPQDVKLYEEKGYYADPTYIYHPEEHEPKMVSAVEAKKAINNGWYLSPAQFPGNEEGAAGLKTLGTLKLKGAS